MTRLVGRIDRCLQRVERLRQKCIAVYPAPRFFRYENLSDEKMRRVVELEKQYTYDELDRVLDLDLSREEREELYKLYEEGRTREMHPLSLQHEIAARSRQGQNGGKLPRITAQNRALSRKRDELKDRKCGSRSCRIQEPAYIA